MRQVMPHRNNIQLRRTNCKTYFETRWKKSLEDQNTGPSASFAKYTASRR
ncbi:MAG TPA: hypothetical protein VKS78_17885 [Roseiarcus sp.]|nr:hypothetical protein [Roseiarcus sp.]